MRGGFFYNWSMRTLLLLSLLAVSAAADPLDDLLKKAGFERADLGWRPRGWWERFPRAVTHKLDHFDDLFAEPLAVVPFIRVLGRATRDLLGPAGLAKKPVRGAHSLRLCRRCGALPSTPSRSRSAPPESRKAPP